MKRIVWLLLVILLCGCTKVDDQMERAMELRAQLIAKRVCFDATILADYGDKIYEFAMNCDSQTDGTLRFTVTAPETIQGISGTVSDVGGKLTFDDTAILFDLMADKQLSPISAPWLLMKTLRSGFLSACCKEEGCLRLSIDDSYKDDALRLEIWMDQQDLPKKAEIYWQGRRLLTVRVSNFKIE